DAGSYSCTAVNSAGRAVRWLSLSLHTMPTFTLLPRDVTLSRGERLELVCAAVGSPQPRISWTANGQLVTDGVSGQSGKSTLRREAATHADSGTYVCHAKNSAGAIRATAFVSIRGDPRRVRGSMVGVINAHELGFATLDARVLDDPHSSSAAVQSSISSVPPTVGPLMRVLVTIIAPVYWSLAHAGGEAHSGFLLTQGSFRHESQLEFATGELLRVTHLARGADATDALLLDSVISGSVPESIGKATVLLQDFSERYVQMGAGRLSGGSVQSFLQDGRIIRARCNHTVTYDPPMGLQPPRVQHVRVSAVETSFDPASEELRFQLRASLDAGADRDQCPPGFVLGPQQLYCLDVNECLQSPPPCAFECRNLRGSYECLCPPGRTL
ncbi:Hemicentin-2, partial [Egretta garzetta]